MRCNSCRRNDRAIFARLFPGRRYVLLCGVCLDRLNGYIHHRLQDGSLLPLRHSNPVRQPYKSHHIRNRMIDIFTAPVRLLMNLCLLAMRTS